MGSAELTRARGRLAEWKRGLGWRPREKGRGGGKSSEPEPSREPRGAEGGNPERPRPSPPCAFYRALPVVG